MFHLECLKAVCWGRFFVYVTDFIKVVSDSVSMKLFADDCILFMNARSASDRVVLQKAIKSVEHWCKDLRLGCVT